MKTLTINRRSLAYFCALVAITLSGLAHGQQSGPVENKGVANKPLGTVDLGPEIDGMTGRQLRIRAVTIEPGGTIATHSHLGRPAVEYVVQGTVTEYRNGVTKVYGPGDVVTANKDTVHGWENKGSTPAILLPVDIIKP